MKKQTGTDASYKFLCTEAEDAHLAGDALKVIHITAVALNQLTDDLANGVKIPFANVRWAFYFSIYWANDDWKFAKLQETLKKFQPLKNREDSQLLHFLLFTFRSHLQGELDCTKLLSLDSKWIKKRSTESYDIAALTLTIELIWYWAPVSESWKTVALDWLEKAKPNSTFAISMELLIARLNTQSQLYESNVPLFTGIDKCKLRFQQKLLVECWGLFFDFKNDELAVKLKQLVNTGLSVDSPHYSSFFTLSHFSRVERESQESQYVSLSRIAHIEARRPAKLDHIIREKKFYSSYTTIAVAGFSDDTANARQDCIRHAARSQINALRNWDFGDWKTGERMKAKIYLEIGARKIRPFFELGLEAAARAGWIPKQGKSPHIDVCLNLLDSLSADDRERFAKKMLKLPKQSWDHVIRVLEELSDAIPESCLDELARWTIDCDQVLRSSKWSPGTSIGIWSDILEHIESKHMAFSILAPRVNEIASDFNHWHHEKELIVIWLVSAEKSLAENTLSKLIEGSCPDHGLADRFAIVFNSVKNRPELSDFAKTWLLGHVDSANIFDKFFLDHIEKIGVEKISDAKFYIGLRNEIIEFCNKNLRRKSDEPVEIGSTRNYHHFFQFLKTNKSDLELIDVLVKVIDKSAVHFVNKVEPLACLCHLVKYGPKVQAKLIFDKSKNWIREKITGQEIPFPGGPLSNVRVSGGNRVPVDGVFLMLLESFALKVPLQSKEMIFEWLTRHALSIRPTNCDSALRICIFIAISFGDESENVISIAAIASAIAQSSFASAPLEVIYGMGSALFPSDNEDFEEDYARHSSRRIFQELFLRYLERGATLANPLVRRSVAEFVGKWLDINSDIPALRILQDKLLEDPRLRVRSALKFRSKEQRTKN